jgi:DNA-binding GntR family transcriptional regulator
MQKIKHSHLSLGNQAYQELKRFILERQIPPGGKLNEGDLASALGISRTPVREAINRLEKEGLVEIFPQRGAFVVQFSEKDIFELFLIRENLEGLAAYLAAVNIDEPALAKLEACLQGFEEPFSERDTRRYAREDFKFHQTIVMLSDARRLITLVSALHDHIRIYRLTTVGVSGRVKASLAEHRHILEALRKKEPEEAERRMREHIRHVRDGVMANVNFFLGTGPEKHPSQIKEEKEWRNSATNSSRIRPRSFTSGP